MKAYYFLIGVLFLGACTSSNNTKEENNKPSFTLNESSKKEANILTVSEQDVEEQLALTGKVEYNENDLVYFKSLLNGTVTSVAFELGDFVKKGQHLAIVKSSDIIDLAQQRRMNISREQLLKQQINTKKELLNDGLASLPEVKLLENDLVQTQIEITKLNEILSLYQMGSEAGTYIIIAPKDGYIIQKKISSGQTINMDSEPLFAISNLKEVWVMVNIFASNLSYVKEGSSVSVRTIAYPNKYYNGKIDKIYNVFDENEHVLKARVVLENKDLQLIPGLSADIFIHKSNAFQKAVAIPKKAIVFNDDTYFVIVYKSDKHLEIRKINSIAENAYFTYTNKGIIPGEKIITNNALLIFEELNKK